MGTDLVRAEDPHPVVTFFTPHEFAGMVISELIMVLCRLFHNLFHETDVGSNDHGCCFCLCSSVKNEEERPFKLN